MEKKHDAATLITKYQNGTATSHERALVEAFMLIDLRERPILPDEEGITYHNQQIAKKLKEYIQFEENNPQEQGGFIQKMLLSPAARIAAVLALVSGITVGTFFWKNDSPSLTLTPTSNEPIATVKPGGNKAYVTTADGQVIDLNESHNTIRMGEDIAYNDGTVVWSAQHAAPAARNTLHTPKGGNYTVVLSDGTQVMLNASSKLSYPNRFNNTQRIVELDGEAFFQVQPALRQGKKIPFVVKTKSQEVEVLGTVFNIKDYNDEKAAKTTLVHGSVRVKLVNQNISKLLSPGQEAVISGNSINRVAVDTSIALDWKNGLIYFNEENLATIMKKIERWYDVDVEFRDIDPQIRFGGSVSKYKNLSDVLHRLELTGDVKFISKGRRIIVTK
ncbi:FecR family protein [Sphingobacterium yanglingense]|uniref:FecR family protein n=1 Tax=Sphingobacterium yanglingense TaxID=1437280 RepID=A0A4R6WRZ6_9SPHI|nr:FecR family protein [Sphingobacterium yanglingense]TDQ79426.1 FecR family protein [Sphingobacterium yanglingense]